VGQIYSDQINPKWVSFKPTLTRAVNISSEEFRHAPQITCGRGLIDDLAPRLIPLLMGQMAVGAMTSLMRLVTPSTI